MNRIIVAAALATAFAAAPALAADPAEGIWATPGGSSKVRVAPCAADTAKLCGTIVWLKTPKKADGSPVTDGNNPDPKLKSRPIQGMAFLSGFKPAAAGRWTGGKIYNPNDGKTYDSKLAVQPDGTLKVEGCVLVVCRGQIWNRSTL